MHISPQYFKVPTVDYWWPVALGACATVAKVADAASNVSGSTAGGSETGVFGTLSIAFGTGIPVGLDVVCANSAVVPKVADSGSTTSAFGVGSGVAGTLNSGPGTIDSQRPGILFVDGATEIAS